MPDEELRLLAVLIVIVMAWAATRDHPLLLLVMLSIAAILLVQAVALSYTGGGEPLDEVLAHAVQDTVVQEHPKEQPKIYCAANYRDGLALKHCSCAEDDNREGCKEGSREVETRSCNHYCYKQMCACCKS